MVLSVKYRDSSGAVCEKAVEAAIGAAVWLLPESKEQPKKEVAAPVKTIKTSVKKAEVAKPATNNTPTLSKRERQLKQIRDKYGDNIPDNLKQVVYLFREVLIRQKEAR